jgi:hypothetical protein
VPGCDRAGLPTREFHRLGGTVPAAACVGSSFARIGRAIRRPGEVEADHRGISQPQAEPNYRCAAAMSGPSVGGCGKRHGKRLTIPVQVIETCLKPASVMPRYLVAKCTNPTCKRTFLVQDTPIIDYGKWTPPLNIWPLRLQCPHCTSRNELWKIDLMIWRPKNPK